MKLHRGAVALALLLVLAACTSAGAPNLALGDEDGELPFDAPTGAAVALDVSLDVSPGSRVISGSPPDAWVATRSVDDHVHVRGRAWLVDAGVDYEFELVDLNGVPRLVAATATYSGVGYEGRSRVEQIEPDQFSFSFWGRQLVAGEFGIGGDVVGFWVPIDGLRPRLPVNERFTMAVGETVRARSIPFRYLTLESIEPECDGCLPLLATLTVTGGPERETQVVEFVDGVGRLRWTGHDGAPVCVVSDVDSVVIDRCAARGEGQVEHIALNAPPEQRGVWDLMQVRSADQQQNATATWRPHLVISDGGGWEGDDGCNVFGIRADRAEPVAAAMYLSEFPCDAMERASAMVMDVLLGAESLTARNDSLTISGPAGTAVYSRHRSDSAAPLSADVSEVLLSRDVLGGGSAPLSAATGLLDAGAACSALWVSGWVASTARDASIMAAPVEGPVAGILERVVVVDTIAEARSAVAASLRVLSTCNTFGTFDPGPNVGGFEFVPLDVSTSADVTVSFRLIKNVEADARAGDSAPAPRRQTTDFVVASVANVVIIVVAVRDDAGAVSAEFIELARAAVDKAHDAPIVCSGAPDGFRVVRVAADSARIDPAVSEMAGTVDAADAHTLAVGWNVDVGATVLVVSEPRSVSAVRGQLEEATPWVVSGAGWVAGIFPRPGASKAGIGNLVEEFGDTWEAVALCAL